MSCLKLGSIKVPQFDRVNYYLWKKKMTLFIEVANPLYMGSILENGPFVPMKMIPESTVDGVRVPQRPTPKDPTEFTDSEKEIVAMDTWLQLIIFDSMDTDMCYQILNCTSGKQMWDTIVLIMEGTEEVKENRLDILTSRYEAFKSLPGETITQVFERYNRLLNELRIQGKNYPLRETNRKFMRTLPHHVEHKVSSIRERDNLNTMPLEKLYGKLKTYEMEHHELGHLATECKEPKQAKDKNVFYEKKSYEELKRENEKLKRRLDPLVAKQQGKAYTAEGKSWDDTDSEEEEEEYRNLALMADSSEASPSSQSFDMPGNTLLPGAKLGWNLETGLERYLNSWKSDDDPSLGEYTNRIDRDGFPQLVVKKGSAIQSRGGFWNGVSFSGTPNLKPNPIYKYDFLSNGKELYYRYEVVNASIVTRRILNPLGYIQRWIWNEKSQTWQLYHSGAKDDCERYAVCGAYGSCNVNGSPTCECLDGFEPKSQKEWDAADWSSGCVRKVQLSCADGEGFVKHSELILPDTQRSWFDKNMSLDECKRACLKNCSCTAYANMDIRGSGSGCLLWFNDLIDLRDQKESGQDLYIRMAASELAKKGRSKLGFIVIPILLTLTMTVGMCLFVIRNKRKHREGVTRQYFENDGVNGKGGEDLELPLFDFTTLAHATNGFSTTSKLGEGGFGPVYKGMLNNGKEIAVKRLSKDSRQGLKEFTNEVSCIAQLQHRNLVKLLGCSMQEGERMLVYEYMPNKSLDSFIFDKKQSKALDWPMRCNIIKGVARGLLYLHQDSRLRIIHRDLKASNVLLDQEMNPKISDFGTARICGETETGANTTRVVGTYGYMSPEYAIDGKFSVKSDVYSFGVLLLEIVSGKRNTNFTHPDHNLNLLGHAWTTYTNGEVLDIVDDVIQKSSREHEIEVFRAIGIGLLCVQQYPADRPTMSSVVLMLTSEIPLPQPKQPGFFTERRLHAEDTISSSNYISITTMAPR